MWSKSKIRGGVFALAVFLGTLASAGIGRAEVALSGTFVAGDNCTAYQSLRKQSNPVGLAKGQSYQIVAANKDNPSHYMIIVPGGSPERRWAPIGCGTSDVAAKPDKGTADTADGGGAAAPTQKPSGKLRTKYVLAASWQPGFCETKPDKVECQSQTAERYDADHFSLHGLWPQPRSAAYCQVDRAAIEDDKAGRWNELPEVTLESATAEELKKVMPGTQSHLERHEWVKHGTCYGEPADSYFSEALAMMRALNGSPVRELFASHVGKFLSFADIQKAFDEGFGAGAGQRVRMQCKRDGGRLIIAELTIGLNGDVTPQSSLGELIAAAAPTKTECPGGIVDPAGQQ